MYYTYGDRERGLVSKDKNEILGFKVLLFGDAKLSEFFSSFTKNGVEAVLFSSSKPEDLKGVKFGVLFAKNQDIHTTEDMVKEIRKKLGNSFKILPIFEKKDYYTFETLFTLDIDRICFDFNPEIVLKELIDYYNYYVETPKDKKSVSNYIINFYENKGTFIVDLSGELQKEKLLALRLMFSNYLINKLSKLRGIVYIFNDIEETSVNFSTLWALFRFWKATNFDYSKIKYLTNSSVIEKKISKYISHLGVKHSKDLLEIVKTFYPDISKSNNDFQIFEFASELLQNDLKKNGN